MAITAHVNAYSNFGMLGTDSWYRKLVHQCFRVKFISKKKKPALCFFFYSLPSLLSRSSGERMQSTSRWHLPWERCLFSSHLPFFPFSFSFDYNPISLPWSSQIMCDISSRYQQKEPNSTKPTTTPYEYVHLYMEMQNISYLL